MRLRRAAVAALAGLPFAMFAVLASLPLFLASVVCLALILVGLGAFLTPPVTSLVRLHANLRRRLDGAWFGIRIKTPYRPPPLFGGGPAGVVQRAQWQLTDPATWRDLLWLLLNSFVGLLLGLASFALILVGIGVWLSPMLMQLSGRLDHWLLAPTRARSLDLRTEELRALRSEAVDASAAELRRIERDLHDGAQARLVAMGMSLGEVERLMEQDPARARERLAETRASSVLALAELRQLVRGIHPPVLADRGLPDAVRALAIDSPLDPEVRIALDGHLEPPIESAAYFAISELLTNAAKHAAATRAQIDIRHLEGRLSIRVTDNGQGGADPALGTGLRGLQRRFAMFDGEVTVASPVGGPTEVLIEVPCALSGGAR